MLKLTGICKRFPGLVALNKVDFDLKPGEVHVLFGENGAGKSTLSNIIAGSLEFDEGKYELFGEPVNRLTPNIARMSGVSAVFQEFSLVSSLSVLENLFLGHELKFFWFANRRAMRSKAEHVLSQLDFQLDLNRVVGRLSRAEKQMTEIAKAVILNSKILILDEPTASLTDAEAEKLLRLVHKLRAGGTGIIYISHRLKEISELADRVTVLRNGRLVGTIEASAVSEQILIEMMTGFAAGELFPKIASTPGTAILSVEGLSIRGGAAQNVSLLVRTGEIVGIAGLAGCGKGAVGRSIAGLDKIDRGKILMDGEDLAGLSVRGRMRRGVCYFPSDRAAEGLALNRPIRENASMGALDLASIAVMGVLRRANERQNTLKYLENLHLRPLAIEPTVETLSGGNRQKVLLARGLMRNTSLFIFDEPTVGVDVGAKAEIYKWIANLAKMGAAVLCISSDLQEVLHMSTRLYVMHEGEIVAELSGTKKTEENVLSGFFGNSHQSSREAAAQ
jgi:ribose transport system ATP-binding protein